MSRPFALSPENALRDSFALAALPVVLGRWVDRQEGPRHSLTKEQAADMAAQSAYLVADAMMKARG